MDGSGLRIEALEHGGEYPDDMPQVVRLIDFDGRAADYVPIKVNGRVVDSKGFSLERLDVFPVPQSKEVMDDTLATATTSIALGEHRCRSGCKKRSSGGGPRLRPHDDLGDLHRHPASANLLVEIIRPPKALGEQDRF
jgi:hypothetical protein